MPLGGISRSQLVSLVKKLHREYGDLPVPPSSDPFCLILWEQVAYLANDERRAEAYAQLKARVGLRPGMFSMRRWRLWRKWRESAGQSP